MIAIFAITVMIAQDTPGIRKHRDTVPETYTCYECEEWGWSVVYINVIPTIAVECEEWREFTCDENGNPL